MAKKKFKISWRTIVSIVTFFLVVIVVWQNWGDITEAVSHLGETNIMVLLILIPEQLLMYYSCGQIFFSYLKATKTVQKVSQWELMQVSFELNFVNHAVPAGGFGGFGYMAWRLMPFGASPGQSSFLYVLRYAVATIANQAQTILAILFLLFFGTIPASGHWAIWATMIMCCGVVTFIISVAIIASQAKRIHSTARFLTKLTNKIVRIITFGKKKNVLKFELVDGYLMDIHKDILIARKNKKLLIKPALWGLLYSFLEIAAYEIVAISLGHGDLFPQIMIGEAVGSVVGAIIPYGLYELGMVGVMSQLGVDVGVAGIIVVMTRVVVLGSTILTGYGFYQHAINTIGKKPNIMEKKGS